MHSSFGVQKNQTSALSLRSSNADNIVAMEANMEKKKVLQKKRRIRNTKNLIVG